MAIASPSKAEQVRRKLGHPVIDADGHMLETTPIFLDFLKEVGGAKMAEKFAARGQKRGPGFFDHGFVTGWWDMTWKERRDTGAMAPFWWFMPTTDTRYRATAHIPRLFYDRLDEFGIDFEVTFGTLSVAFGAIPGIQDEELRKACCRAFNNYVAELYRDYADRLTPAAVVPMHTPEEAVEEIEHIKKLGLKAAMFPSYVVREVKREPGNENIPDALLAPWRMDFFGIDSDYDYDPVWAKCVEVGLAPCFHGTANGIIWGARNSPSNLMYNTVGNFAESGDAVSKALFMGGVSRRFPGLRMGFLEGGVGRGMLTWEGMIEFWKKRNPRSLRENLEPAKLDVDEAMRLIDEYGEPRIKAHSDAIRQMFEQIKAAPTPDVAGLDDWHGAKIEKPQDFKTLYQDNYFWGCEADDPTVVWAFREDVNSYGMKYRAFMGSDISHCDVTDPTDVLPEAYEFVEDGHMSDEDFKDFVFGNAVRLYGGMNPDFFKGTVVEAEAAKYLAQERGS